MKPPFPDGTISSFSPNTKHFFLSNFFTWSVTYEGITYPTSEHAYQAAKVTDTDTRMMLMRVAGAAAVKKAGQIVACRVDWSVFKFQAMKDVLATKFKLDNLMADLLLNTGDAVLIEGNYWHDRIWGQCFCQRHNWEGQNNLGALLMERRAELRGIQNGL